MKLCTLVLSLLVVCAVSYAVEHGPLINVLQPVEHHDLVQIEPVQNIRPKRHLLLGKNNFLEVLKMCKNIIKLK